MKRNFNVLVTGCGGDIGQSIGKILKSNVLFSSIIGCDLHENHAGKFIFDKSLVIVPCREESYFSYLEQIVNKYKIDIIIPTSEAELRLLFEKNISKELFGKILITANLKALKIGLDKLSTANFLKSSSLPFPETRVVSEITEPKLPLFLKSRNGSGSKSQFILKNQADFEYYKNKYPEFVAQELLKGDDEEYTCGVFRYSKGEIRAISFRRKLLGGFSGFGIVVENDDIHKVLIHIAEGLELQGSINIQLRLTKKGPCVFEINPRFSSTVLFRHMMGFQDVIWSIEDYLGTCSPYKAPQVGTKFYKGFNEYIDLKL